MCMLCVYRNTRNTAICVGKYIYICVCVCVCVCLCVYPPKDGEGLTILGNLKSFEGPVLNCRGSTTHRALYLNELVIFPAVVK